MILYTHMTFHFQALILRTVVMKYNIQVQGNNFSVSDKSCVGSYINLIFGFGSRERGLSHPDQGLPRRCTTAAPRGPY